MTLGQFISEMEAGWGFAHPGTVKSLGTALRHAFEGTDLNREVEVTYKKTDWGSGYYGRIFYDWTVKGVEPTETGDLPPSDADVVFGRGLPAFCRKIEGGFTVGYSK